MRARPLCAYGRLALPLPLGRLGFSPLRSARLALPLPLGQSPLIQCRETSLEKKYGEKHDWNVCTTKAPRCACQTGYRRLLRHEGNGQLPLHINTKIMHGMKKAALWLLPMCAAFPLLWATVISCGNCRIGVTSKQ